LIAAERFEQKETKETKGEVEVLPLWAARLSVGKLANEYWCFVVSGQIHRLTTAANVSRERLGDRAGDLVIERNIVFLFRAIVFVDGGF
jgi:hypothetical protein